VLLGHGLLLIMSGNVIFFDAAKFDACISQELGDSFTLPPVSSGKPKYASDNPQEGDFDLEPYEDDVESPAHVPAVDLVDAAGKPILQESFADRMINAEVLLPHEKMNAVAKVVKQLVDANGKVVGSFHATHTTIIAPQNSNDTVTGIGVPAGDAIVDEDRHVDEDSVPVPTIARDLPTGAFEMFYHDTIIKLKSIQKQRWGTLYCIIDGRYEKHHGY
jgi:hypothetical protein